MCFTFWLSKFHAYKRIITHLLDPRIKVFNRTYVKQKCLMKLSVSGCWFDWAGVWEAKEFQSLSKDAQTSTSSSSSNWTPRLIQQVESPGLWVSVELCGVEGKLFFEVMIQLSVLAARLNNSCLAALHSLVQERYWKEAKLNSLGSSFSEEILIPEGTKMFKPR